jgi:hypothetical protein
MPHTDSSSKSNHLSMTSFETSLGRLYQFDMPLNIVLSQLSIGPGNWCFLIAVSWSSFVVRQTMLCCAHRDFWANLAAK